MNKHELSKSDGAGEKPNSGGSTGGLITPAVLIALITATVGPLSLYYFEDINQKRVLQEKLLSKMLDHTVSGSSSEMNMDKLAIIIALVQDNEEMFGLSFPSTEDILAQKSKLLVQKLQSDLANRTAEAEKARTELGSTKGLLSAAEMDIATKESNFKRITEEINFLSKNRSANKDLIKKLSDEKSGLQSAIDASNSEIQQLKQKESMLSSSVSDLNIALKTSQSDIALLSERDQEKTKIIDGLKAVITDKENERQAAQEAAAKVEKENNYLSEQVSKLQSEINSLKYPAEPHSVGVAP